MFTYLLLTCSNRKEAEKIAHVLLEHKLIACTKYIPVDCSYWWHGKIVDDQEILLVMESVASKFEQVQTEVKKLHSYDTFVLQALPIAQVSKGAAQWLTDTLSDKV